MNNLNDEESQSSTYMDLSNEFDNNTKIMETLNTNRRNYGKVDNLRSIQELPPKFQNIFDFPFFNMIQSTIMDDVLYSDKGIVVSAPTSSGKTVVFELAIIRLLMKIEDTNYSGGYKMIYVAPVKALCNERLSEWHSKFCKIGLSCIVVTGDSDIVNLSILENYHIIITTPEKWDSLTRNVKDNDLLKNVKLFMIDEVHLLNEETRGPILEAIVCRFKVLKKFDEIRFIAVSSTIPNIEDIAEWLGTDHKAAVHFKIDEKFRPVKLNKIVLGYPCKSGSGSFKFDLSLNYKLQSVIMQYAEGKPTLIFCSTRKGVEMTAAHISKAITFHLPIEQKQKLQQSAQTMLDSKMKMQLSNGVGCHHGGMTPENRLTIENLFRAGFLPVLITTSTLAMGVNLPAHLVIIKSTEFYTQGGFQDYSESSLMQMIGRAGRPQFDTSATVVIMTKNWQKEKYERMIGGTELIESNLHRHLTEHLNAEVVLGIISDIAVALDWIRQTFLYIRVQKNPKHYNIPTNFKKAEIEKKLQDLCQIEINALNRYGMLQIDQTDGFSLYPTNMGKIMANYYLAFNTMKLFVEIKGNEGLFDILNIITKASEFTETYLRVNDKKTLNTLNRCKYQDTIRFPLPGNIKTSAMKVNCIIQAIFGCLRIQDPSLLQESQKIMKIGERVSNCLVEYLLHKDNCFTALLNALILNQCFHAKIWENSAHVSRQLHKIGTVLSSMLVTAGKTTFKSILESSPRAIELIINRNAPMGNQIQDEILHLPFYRIKVNPPENNIFKAKIVVTLLNPENISPTCTAGLNSCMTLIVGDSDNHILCCKKIYHNSMAVCKEHIQYVDVVSHVDHVIQAYLVSENWVGIDCQDKVDIILNLSSINTNNERNIMQTPKSNTIKKAINTPITQYFKVNKIVPNQDILVDVDKKTRPKKITCVTKNKTKPIESYFSKEKSNQNLGYIVPPPSQNLNLTNIQNKDDNRLEKEINIEQDVREILENDNLVNTQISQIENNNKKFTFKMRTNINDNKDVSKNIKLNSFDKFEQSLKKVRESSNTTNQNESIINIQEIYIDNKTNENVELNLGNDNIMNANSNQTKNDTFDFANFSFFENNSQKNDYDTNFYPSHLGDLFSQSQNYSQCSLFLKNNNKMENKYSTKSNDENRKLPNTIESSINSQYSNISQTKTQTNTLKPLISKETKLVSHLSNKNFLSTYQKSVGKKQTKAHEMLKEFQIKSKKKFQHTSTSMSTRQKTQNEENILENNDQFENCTYKIVEIISQIEKINNNNTEENIDISKQQNENQSFPNSREENTNNVNEEIINVNSLADEIKIEKPAFPKSFKEYVQETVKKLKKETLVNEYYNFDIGIEEFLMAPLTQNFEDSENEENTSNHENVSQNYPNNDTLKENSTQNKFNFMSPINWEKSSKQPTTQNTSNNKSFDFDNITFVSQISGSECPNEYANCTINFENETNFIDDNMEMDTSSISSYHSEENNKDVRVKNKSKIIEQWIDSQATQTEQINQKSDQQNNNNNNNKKPRLSFPLIYSSNTYPEEENKNISENILQNEFFGINKNNENKKSSLNSELTKSNSNPTLMKRSSYSGYCVEDETNYEVVIFKKQESYLNNNENIFGNNWSPDKEKKKNDQKIFSFPNNVFY